MTSGSITPRPVSRVIVIDDRDRVLLFDTRLAYTRVWMLPGGALQPGETREAAAARELWEETGFGPLPLSPCVWKVRFRFSYRGLVYDQDEHYFAVRTLHRDISTANLESAEANEILEARWWSLSEIERSSAAFRPRGLAELLPPIIRGDYPSEPLQAGVEGSARVVASDP